MSRKTAREIDCEAADWAARVDRGPMSAEEERDFAAWLESDSRRLGAFGRMRAIALSTERARALGSDFNPAAFAPSWSRRTMLRAGGGLAAASLIGAAIGWERLRRGFFQTGRGEVKVIALKDGSVVTLNTESQIAVDFTTDLRSVRLIQGEALFDVAKNPERPFIVGAGETQVRVIGTSFTVRRIDTAPVQILVSEGTVEVSKPQLGTRPVRISANTRAIAPLDDRIAARPIAPAQLRRELAWQDGRIAFEGQTLAQAAAEFSRYSDIKIIIDDNQLAHEEIAGLFKANDPVGFAQTIAVSLNAHAKIGEGEVRLHR